MVLAPAELKYWKNFGKSQPETILCLFVESLLTRSHCFSHGVEFGWGRVF